MKKDAFPPFVMVGASVLPERNQRRLIKSVTLTVTDRSGHAERVAIRDKRTPPRVNLLTDLPTILEDAAQAIEDSIKQSPKVMTFAAKLTWIVEKVKQESRSKTEHYQEILELLDPDIKMTPEALTMMVSRERKRQKNSAAVERHPRISAPLR